MVQALGGSRSGCLGLHGCWPVGSGGKSSSLRDPLQFPLVSWSRPSHHGPDRPAQAGSPLHMVQGHCSPLFTGTVMSSRDWDAGNHAVLGYCSMIVSPWITGEVSQPVDPWASVRKQL